ncbi:MAG TPA: mandelate racemase/muconate lactonizing enzyme family protein, partial [Bryobacteraceae bacterium]|nr:mandelate racemase/muconate lactonizing enzyme family protein [Bryobacteraceae bacterium]
MSGPELRRRDFIAASLALAAVRRLEAAVKPVKIVSVDAFPIEIPVSEAEKRAGVQLRFQVARVTTDAGISGWSFAGPPESALNDIRPMLAGADLFNVEGMLRRGLNRYAGVEHAVWDAIGRIANQPVYKLFAGPRDRLKAYLTCVWSGPADQSHVPAKDQVAMALKIQKAGFNAMKIRIWRPNPMDDVAVCRQILEATGSGFRLMVDRTAQMPVSMANQQVWNFETGLKVARALEQAGVYWLEEPFHRDDYDSPAKLAGMVDILITGGEGYSSLEPYKQCLMHRSYDILQPDPHQAGGILMCRKVAVLAESFHVPAIPHGYIGLPLAGWFQASLAM